MERNEEPEILEFRGLISEIKSAFNSLKNVILTQKEKDEERELLNQFDDAVQVQTFSTLNHLIVYQEDGWRELADGRDDDEGANRSTYG